MGFYSPSQLIQDARRHHIMVLPIDVNHSSWDHQVLSSPNRQQPPIRLGLRLVKGLSKEAGERIYAAQRGQGFSDIGDLRRRASLDRRSMEALAAADALLSISGNRYQSHWQTMAMEDESPLLPADTHLHHHHDEESAIESTCPRRGGDCRLPEYGAHLKVASTGLAASSVPI